MCETLSRGEFKAGIDGVFDVLASQQVPFEFVSEKGGGLVATFRAGANDEDGKARADNPIAGLAGVSMGSVVSWSEDRTYPDLDAQVPIPSIDLRPGRPYFRYVRVAKGAAVADGIGDRLLSFTGPYVEVAAGEGTDVAAHILEMDQTMVNMRPFNRRGQFPGDPRWPLVTLREGPGRVAYVAASLEPERNRVESYEIDRLLRNVVVWAGGPPPVAASNVPPSVHLSLSAADEGDRLILVLTNQSTHPIRHGSIRYVIPVSDLELRLETDGRKVSGVDSASGLKVDLQEGQDAAVVKIPRLHVAECIVLRLE